MAHILVVEDDPDLRLLLRVVLERAGHEVTEASDGHEGYEAITGATFDLVTLDNTMPVMTGLDVLLALHETPPAHRPLIVVVSAIADPGFIRTVLDAGADDFVAKPFSPLRLAEHIHELLTSAPAPALAGALALVAARP